MACFVDALICLDRIQSALLSSAPSSLDVDGVYGPTVEGARLSILHHPPPAAETDEDTRWRMKRLTALQWCYEKDPLALIMTCIIIATKVKQGDDMDARMHDVGVNDH